MGSDLQAWSDRCGRSMVVWNVAAYHGFGYYNPGFSDVVYRGLGLRSGVHGLECTAEVWGVLGWPLSSMITIVIISHVQCLA